MIPISLVGSGRLEVSSDHRAVARPAPSRHRLMRKRAMSLMIVLLVCIISLLSFAGFIDLTRRQHAQNVLFLRVRGVRTVLLALLDAETAVRGFMLTGHVGDLQPYYAGVATLQGEAVPSIRVLDAAGDPASPGVANFASRRIAQQLKLWEELVALGPGAGTRAAALDATEDKPSMDQLRDTIVHAIGTGLAEWQRNDASLEVEQDLLLITNAAAGFITVLALIYALHRSARETAQREHAMAEALRSREQAIAGREEVRQVFAMAEALQSAAGLPDGAAILRASAMRLLPSIGGALYVFNNSRDRLDLIVAWEACQDDDRGPVAEPAAFLIPSECWALKRGKPHLNDDGPDSLRCCHAPLGACSLEMPMIGRGEPVGLLVLQSSAVDAAHELSRASDIASVLAESMSLALSSILLREKLRNQAVRDSLTGLYNRRFLEEVLQTLSMQAQRRQAELSAIMIDLDSFKRLNDEHGHAMGDTVLRAAAAAIVSTLRASDVACRYGGEELVVLMPDCSLEMAIAKAEQIRERIARLSRDGGPKVSASLGIGCMPLTARDSDELLSSADAALYEAKQQGRNRVVAAPPLTGMRPEFRAGISLYSLALGSLRVGPHGGSEGDEMFLPAIAGHLPVA